MPVAFLRGMNLGRRRITNVELAAIFEDFGLAEVRCYRASGNVLFEGEATEEALERHLQGALGYPVKVFLRTVEELDAICAFAFSREGKTQVNLLREDPPAEVLEYATQDDLLALGPRCLYWQPIGRSTDSVLDHRALDKLHGRGTMRTMGTLTNIRKKL